MQLLLRLTRAQTFFIVTKGKVQQVVARTGVADAPAVADVEPAAGITAKGAVDLVRLAPTTDVGLQPALTVYIVRHVRHLQRLPVVADADAAKALDKPGMKPRVKGGHKVSPA